MYDLYDVEPSDFITIDNRLVVLSSLADDEIEMLKREASRFPEYDKIFEQEAFGEYAQLTNEVRSVIRKMDVDFFTIVNGQKVTKISWNLVVTEFLPYDRSFYGI